MKNFKKIISVILTLCMLMQVLPVFANETETPSVVGYNLIFDNQFETEGDTEGWVKGSVKSGTPEFTVSQGEAPTGEGALILASDGADNVAYGKQPNVFKALDEKVSFSADKNIVIETKFLQTGNGATSEDGTDASRGKTVFKINQPNNRDLLSYDDLNWQWKNTLGHKEDAKIPNWTGSAANREGWFRLFAATTGMDLEQNVTNFTYVAEGDQTAKKFTSLANVNTLNKWVEAKIVLSADQTYTISAVIDGTEYPAAKGSFKQEYTGAYASYTLHNDKTATEWVTEFPSLDSLTYLQQGYANNLYVDYVKVYEVGNVKVSATVPGGKTFEDAISVKFATDSTEDIGAVIESAVSVEGVNTTNSYNAETKVLTVTPEAVEKGSTYKLVIDKAKLSELGINYSGTSEFTLRARGARDTGVALNENFAGTTDGLVANNAAVSIVSVTDDANVTGAKDDKALKISMASAGTVTKDLVNGIDFAGKNVYLETRIKKVSDTANYYINVNNPSGYNRLFGYVVDSGYPGVWAIGSVNGDSVGFHNNIRWGTSSNNKAAYAITNKWITYKIEFVPASDAYKVSMYYTDENGAEQKVIEGSAATLKATTTALKNEYGAGYTDSAYFTSLDSLSFESATGGDFYVDYVKVYKASGLTAYGPNGSTVDKDGAFEIKFIDSSDASLSVDSIPAGAVTVDGVETAESYDNQTQILSLKPATALTTGETYKVRINKEVLSGVGISYTGSEEFEIRAREARESGVVINDNFATGTDGWVAGKAQEGFEATLNAVDDEGARDGRALEVTLPKQDTSVAKGSNYGTVTKVLGGGIEIKDDNEVTIETRIKVSEGTNYDLRVNRPDTLEQVSLDYGYKTFYRLFGYTFSDNYPGVWAIGSISGNDYSVDNNFRWATSSNNKATYAIGGKWVTYKVKFVPSEGKYKLTMTITGDDGSEQTVVSDRAALLKAAKLAIEKEYGAGYYDSSAASNAYSANNFFKALDTLTFTAAETGGTILIDYVKVYEKSDVIAYSVNGSKVDKDGAFEFIVCNSADTTSEASDVPAGVFKVEGVEVTESYNEETGVISLKPATSLTEGQVYKVTVNTAKLAESGMNYAGTTEFNITARGAYKEGTIINDNFAENASGWEVGPSQAGFEASAPVVEDVEGAKDGKALKLVFPARDTSVVQPSNYGNVAKSFGSGVEFKNSGTVTVEARIMRDAGTSFELKANRPNTLSQIANDYVYTHYSILEQSTGKNINVMRALNSKTNYVYMERYNVNPLSTDLAGKWVTYKLVFKPAEGKYDTTITYTDGDNEVEVVTNNSTGNMIVAKDAIDAEYGKGYFDANKPQYFKALENLTFTSETGGTIYLDYVKVYESNTASAHLLTGRRIETDGVFEVKFTGERAIEEDISSAVSVIGAEVTKSFDKDTQVVTLTPSSLTKGETYKVTIDKAKLSALGINYTGTTSFESVAVAPRTSALGEVFKTDFEEGTLEGWKAGVANEGYGATVEPSKDGEDNVLKVTLPKVGNDVTGGNQSVAIYELENGVEFVDGKYTVIKARTKNTEDTEYLININRQDSLNQPAHLWQLSGYAIAGYMIDTKTGLLTPEFGSAELHTYANGNQYKWLRQFTHDANKNEFSFDGVSLKDKWIDWTIILDGTENKMEIAVEFEHNGENVSLVTFDSLNDADMVQVAQVLNWEYGSGSPKKTFNGLDSISFVSRDPDTDTVLYIDDVSVEVVDKNDAEAVASANLKVNNETVTELSSGDVVVPEFTIDAKVGGGTYYGISAIYVDGLLSDFNIEEITVETSAKTTIESDFSYVVPSGGEVTVKGFVWKTKFGADPLGETAVAQKKNEFSVYVSTKGSDETGTGAFNAPVATLSKALDVADDFVDSNKNYNGAVDIVLEGGKYNVSDTVKVTASKITVPKGGLNITNKMGETPVISGGVDYDIKDAEKVTDNAILSRLHSEDAKNNLYVLDLGDDVPDAAWPGEASFGVRQLVEAQEGIKIPSKDAYVTIDGKKMTIARWPNEDVTEGSINGGYKVAGLVAGNIDEATAENLNQGVVIGCDYDKLSSWATADQALVFGYLKNDWAVQTTPLKSIDTVNKTIETKYASRYGADYHARYYVYNLLEEIDVPGEYFIERKGDNRGKLYFYMPENADENSKITFSANTKTLLSLDSIENVTVNGIKFTDSLGTGVEISSGKYNKVTNCEFTNINGKAVSAYTKECLIDGNYIHDTNGGITVGSDTPSNSAKYLKSINNVVSNNKIERYGIIDKVYVDAISCSSVGNKILNNEINDAEHLAIRVAGYNNIIQYNEIYDVCQEVDDAGAIYVGKTWTSRNNKIINNYFHDIYTNIDCREEGAGRSPIAAIFLDDHYAGAYIEGNIFANIGGSAIRSNRGREAYINNNLFVNCTEQGVALSSLTKDDGKTIEDYESQYRAVLSLRASVDETSWRNAIEGTNDTFEALLDTADASWAKPEKFTVTNNIMVNTLPNWKGSVVSAGGWIKSIESNNLSANTETTTDPGFNDMANGDYTIDLSKLQALTVNFKDLGFAKMGRNK